MNVKSLTLLPLFLLLFSYSASSEVFTKHSNEPKITFSQLGQFHGVGKATAKYIARIHAQNEAAKKK